MSDQPKKRDQTKKTGKPAHRGAKMTPQKRAAQFPGEMEVRKDGNMWCIPCGVKIGHSEKSMADGHIGSQAHKKMKIQHSKVNMAPGPSVCVIFVAIGAISFLCFF